MPAESTTIRPATALDLVFLEDMLYEALFVPPGMDPFPTTVLNTPALRKYVDGFGSAAGDVGFIATSEDRSVGAVWARRMPEDDPGFGYVDADTPEMSLAVIPELRGNGVGTVLLEALLEVAPRCSLSCDDRNPAVGLYERYEFEIIDHDEHSLVMLRAG